MVQSCAECQRRKIRCDRTVPCLQCRQRGLEHTCVPGTWKRGLNRRNKEQTIERLQAYIQQLENALSIRGTNPKDLPPLKSPSEGHGSAHSRDATDDEAYADPSSKRQLTELNSSLKRFKMDPDLVLGRQPPDELDSSDPAHSEDQVESENVAQAIQMKLMTGNSWRLLKPAADKVQTSDRHVDKAALLELIAFLPSPNWYQCLLHNYFGVASFMSGNILHRPSFLSQAHQCFDNIQQGRFENIRLEFLAVVFSVLSFSVKHLYVPVEKRPDEPILPNEVLSFVAGFDSTRPELSQGPRSRSGYYWTKAALRCLDEVDFLTSANLQVITAIMLLQQAEMVPDGLRIESLLAVALEHIKKLGLHQMGKTLASMSPQEKEKRRRSGASISYIDDEVPRRLWCWAMHCVAYRSLHTDGVWTMPLHTCNTQPPSNADDCDITEDSIAIKPDDVDTDTSFIRMGLMENVMQIRRVGDLEFQPVPGCLYPVPEMPGRLSHAQKYEKVKAFTAELQQLKGKVPVSWTPTEFEDTFFPDSQLDSSPPSGSYTPLTGDLRLRLCRSLLMLKRTFKLLRIHRPYMKRSKYHSEFHSSGQLAVRAAHDILVLQRRLLLDFPTMAFFGFLGWMTITSVLLLQVELIDGCLSPDFADKVRKEIDISVDRLEQLRQQGIPLTKALQVIRYLMEEDARKQAERGADTVVASKPKNDTIAKASPLTTSSEVGSAGSGGTASILSAIEVLENAQQTSTSSGHTSPSTSTPHSLFDKSRPSLERLRDSTMTSSTESRQSPRGAAYPSTSTESNPSVMTRQYYGRSAGLPFQGMGEGVTATPTQVGVTAGPDCSPGTASGFGDYGESSSTDALSLATSWMIPQPGMVNFGSSSGMTPGLGSYYNQQTPWQTGDSMLDIQMPSNTGTFSDNVSNAMAKGSTDELVALLMNGDVGATSLAWVEADGILARLF